MSRREYDIEPITINGIVVSRVVIDLHYEEKHSNDIDGICPFEWRQGIKHDCSSIMEFQRVNGHFVNGPEDYLKRLNSRFGEFEFQTYSRIPEHLSVRQESTVLEEIFEANEILLSPPTHY